MFYNHEEQEEEQLTPEEVAEVMAAMNPEEPPLVGLGSDLSETAAQSVVQAFIQFNGGRILPTEEQEDEESEEDIEFYISSGGGSVNDMFAVYDMMKIVKQKRDIATLGFGKIYSAAVPLLAAGTKGKRYMARNARLMIHHCSMTMGGATKADIRTTFTELKHVEDLMVQAIADNSKLSVGEIHNILSRNTDEFFSAEEALEMGIVDKII